MLKNTRNGAGLMQTADPTMLAPSQAARILGVTPARIVQLANEGRLPAVRTALGRLFEADDVERLARERAEKDAA